MNEAIAERDQFRCVRCGTLVSGPGKAVHHRVLGNRKQNAAWNLILLCTPCHEWCHAHSEAARKSGWIISRHAARPHLVAVRYDQPGRSGWFTLGADLTTSAGPVP